jgi:hypothetical protein
VFGYQQVHLSVLILPLVQPEPMILLLWYSQRHDGHSTIPVVLGTTSRSANPDSCKGPTRQQLLRQSFLPLLGMLWW